jgi:peptidoglycan hydrolase-like protein with peptidoglycan-binding domain
MQNGMLQQGDNGGDVKTLQQALTGHGFSPGAIDGMYGQGTVAAVIAFQKSEGLLPDGVAGPRTLSANWLRVFGVGESVVQYEGKAGENAMHVKRQDAVPGS